MWNDKNDTYNVVELHYFTFWHDKFAGVWKEKKKRFIVCFHLQLLFREGFFVPKHRPSHNAREHGGGEVLPGESALNILQ